MVQSVLPHQLIVGSILCQPSIVKDEDLVCIYNCTEPVSNHNDRLTLHQFGNRLLNQDFIFRVKGCCCLVKQNNGRIFQQCAGDGNTLALTAGKPLVPVHHLAGHIASNYIAHPELKPPYLCLVVSGGHSHLVEVLSYTTFRILGRTRDDAAGECFDKCARAMGYPYPGGIHLDKASKNGNPDAFSLPRPKIAGNAYDFSFSGLKTAVVNLLHNTAQKGGTICKEDLAASVQATIAGILTEHTMRAAREHGYSTIAVAGGVSANSGVRAAMQEACDKQGYRLYLPPLHLCGDNGAMIACAGSYAFDAGIRADSSLNASATMELTAWGELGVVKN